MTQGQILVSMLAAAIFGSAIGFLTYNFNPSSTFMGDMGAYTLGFVLAILAIKLKFADQSLNVTWMVPVLRAGIAHRRYQSGDIHAPDGRAALDAGGQGSYLASTAEHWFIAKGRP